MTNPENPFDLIKRLLAQKQINPRDLFKNYLGLIIIVSIIALSILYKMFFTYVGPNEYGIKVKQVGFNAGVQKKVYGTGLHFLIPTMQSMERLPRDIQTLELTETPRMYRRMRNIKTGRPAHIQTSDGFYVDVDCTILYRIKDPYKVITTLGKKGIYESSILPKVEPAIKRTLGKLTTEEFYNSPLRVEKTNDAKKILQVEFEEKGLEVINVLVRYFHYSEEIQKNIEEKKLKDQLVFKNKAEARAAFEESKLKKVIEEGEANVSVALAKGEAYVTMKNAERDNYVRKIHARADLLIKEAEAEKTRLKNIALRMGGSNQMVGIEMAKVLGGLETIILSSDGKNGLNPLDLKKTLNMFEVR